MLAARHRGDRSRVRPRGQDRAPERPLRWPPVRALGERAATFRLSDLNPIRSIYEGVKSKITSSNPGEGYNLKFSSTLPFAFSGPIKLPAPIEIDQRAVNRAIAAGINAQVKQNYQRSRAMIQYGRNPIAWHGAPPH